jgi:F-type H+-transporting ATPase subunit alpha
MPEKKDFEYYLNKTGEVGFTDQVFQSVIHVHGLPNAHPGEVVLFETGEIGYIMALNVTSVEISLLSHSNVRVGTRVARTNSQLKIRVGDDYLGKFISSVDLEKNMFVFDEENSANIREIDGEKDAFSDHYKVTETFETGVSTVDLLVPLAKGQRELVLGDRKTGKTNFLLQTLLYQAQRGTICIYASIAKQQEEIQHLAHFFKEKNIDQNIVFIASSSAHRPGIIFLTPYVAMTIAEYFKDQGKNVLLVLDDLTAQANYYRELMLLARRFPGRNSYPGDIFHIHARLLERAGHFDNGSITCLPAAQSVVGDMSGYVQTNLMSITDGHIYFDTELINQGKRPAINPFISVTRVGEQTQTPLVREISRRLRSFLTKFERIKQFKHFEEELNETVRNQFELGEQLSSLLDQSPTISVPLNINQVLFACIWTGFWKHTPVGQVKTQIDNIVQIYKDKKEFQTVVDEAVQKSHTLTELIDAVKLHQQEILSYGRKSAAAAASASYQPTKPAEPGVLPNQAVPSQPIADMPAAPEQTPEVQT